MSPVEQTEQQTQTEVYDTEIQTYNYKIPTNQNENDELVQDREENVDEPKDDTVEPVQTEQQTQHGRYPKRETKPPRYLEDYTFNCNDGQNVTSVSVDYCYRAACGIPQTYKEALMSPEAASWERAMAEEMNSLKENETFELTTLPEGRTTVAGKWVYAVKENNQRKMFKARYVAKGYSQTEGIDYQ